MISIVDTDALLGMISVQDPLHTRTKRVAHFFHDQQAILVVSPTTLAEFSLVGLRRLGLPPMKKAIASFLEELIIEKVEKDDMLIAERLFANQRSKANSFCDCCVMVLAKRLHADCIFSFDQGYTKNGFVLAEDFLKKRE